MQMQADGARASLSLSRSQQTYKREEKSNGHLLREQHVSSFACYFLVRLLIRYTRKYSKDTVVNDSA